MKKRTQTRTTKVFVTISLPDGTVLHREEVELKVSETPAGIHGEAYFYERDEEVGYNSFELGAI